MREVNIEIPAPNTAKVFLPNGLTLFYSYTTVVGFRSNVHGYVFTDKTYSNTTSKHLKNVFGSDKSDRVPHEEFESKLQEAYGSVFVKTE